MTLFLTPDELRTWTGYKHPKRQIAWLRMKGYKFDVNRANQPIVSRSYWERLMGGEPGREGAFHNFATVWHQRRHSARSPNAMSVKCQAARF